MTGGGPLLSRRQMFAAGSLVVAVSLQGTARAAWNGGPIAETSALSGDAFNIFIAIEPSGQINFVAPNAEIGQGIFTTEAQIVAEELGCDFARMRILAAPVDPRYNSPILHQQVTVGSSSVRGFYKPLRIAGAQTRIRLIAAAAKRWGVPAAECSAVMNRVTHAGSGRSLDYGALAEAAVREPVPPEDMVVLTPASQFRIIGKSVPRMDVAEKANGSAVYGMDIVRPGMKYAAVDSCPIIRGRLQSVDPAPALAVAGVRMVIPLPNAVAVLADNSWAAFKGLAALSPVWAGDRSLDDAGLQRQIVAARNDKPAFNKTEGDAPGAMAQADERLDLVFDQPFLAHTPMEPINATVDLTADGCDIWVGTQAPDRIRAAAAKVSGLPPEKIRVWNQLSGGGFGRRGSPDYIPPAIMIAKKAGVPVKMIWSREQDMRASLLRPLWRHEVSFGLKDRRVSGWTHKIVGGSVVGQAMPQMLKIAPDIVAVDGAVDLIYDVGPQRFDYVRADPPLPITFWRSVGPGHNMFVVEGAINEAAARLDIDPVEFRRSILKDKRAREVLDMAVEKAGWSSPKAEGVGRGVAIQHAFGGYLACIIEALVDAEGDIRVRRATIAADVGQAINPDGAKSQIEGGLIYGLTAALWGKISVERGEMVETNFHSYRMMRIDETPAIDVHLMPSEGPPQGVGEAGTSIAFPALAAAVFDATGVRIRSLPLNRHAELAGKTRLRGENVAMPLAAVALRKLLADDGEEA